MWIGMLLSLTRAFSDVLRKSKTCRTFEDTLSIYYKLAHNLILAVAWEAGCSWAVRAQCARRRVQPRHDSAAPTSGTLLPSYCSQTTVLLYLNLSE